MTGIMVPLPRLSPEDRTQLECLHGELLHEAAQLDAENATYGAAVARARAYRISVRLGWSA